MAETRCEYRSWQCVFGPRRAGARSATSSSVIGEHHTFAVPFQSRYNQIVAAHIMAY